MLFPPFYQTRSRSLLNCSSVYTEKSIFLQRFRFKIESDQANYITVAHRVSKVSTLHLPAPHSRSQVLSPTCLSLHRNEQERTLGMRLPAPRHQCSGTWCEQPLKVRKSGKWFLPIPSLTFSLRNSHDKWNHKTKSLSSVKRAWILFQMDSPLLLLL